jgi:hypothetical protein
MMSSLMRLAMGLVVIGLGAIACRQNEPPLEPRTPPPNSPIPDIDRPDDPSVSPPPKLPRPDGDASTQAPRPRADRRLARD